MTVGNEITDSVIGRIKMFYVSVNFIQNIYISFDIPKWIKIKC